MEIVNLLIYSSVTVLKLLINQYEENKISKEEFKKHTEIKIKFLKNNMYYIKSPEEKKEVQDVLLRCAKIIGEGK